MTFHMEKWRKWVYLNATSLETSVPLHKGHFQLEVNSILRFHVNRKTFFHLGISDTEIMKYSQSYY